MNIYSNQFTVRFDASTESLLIFHPDHEHPLINIYLSTLEQLDFAQASEFIGCRLILLIPALREKFEKYYEK